jgi:LmbE family N-acetylglucosaminyl deacetylase
VTDAPAGSLWVVSPHLDDAVLSCGRLLAASIDPVVLTIFGGTPPGPGLAAHEWDLGTTGHEDALEAVAVRQEEDRAATALLGAAHRWTTWSQYHEPQPTADELVAALDVLDAKGTDVPHTVVVPLGIFHPDHVAVSDAALRRVREHRGADEAIYYVYADVPYFTEYPAKAEERLERWRSDVRLEAAELPQAPAVRRIEAVDAYATQMPMLRALLPHIDEDLRDTERFWRVGATRAE